MAPKPNPLNVKPMFETTKLPCEGKVGDVIVISPLQEDQLDTSNAGLASIWVCTRASFEPEALPAIWIRLKADGKATCEFPTSDPPQDIPTLRRG